LVGGPPGIELHTVVEEPPSGAAGEMFPIVVMPIGVGMVPNAAAGAIAVGDIVGANAVVVAAVPSMNGETVLSSVDDAGTGAAVMEGGGRGGSAGGCGAGTVEPGKSVMNELAGCADNVRGVAVPPTVGVEEAVGTADVVVGANIEGSAPVVPAIEERDVTGTAGVPGVICPVGVEQVTTVPGIVGSEASGTGANVVSGAAWVNAENGLGPLSGEDWIAPGVDGRPMAVLPMVVTCARQAWAPDSRATVVNSKRRIANSFPRVDLARPRLAH
jgi:hypothetical protein